MSQKSAFEAYNLLRATQNAGTNKSTKKQKQKQPAANIRSSIVLPTAQKSKPMKVRD